MPADITQYGTIVPLDYEEGRKEFAVVFVSHDWSELYDLLEDPEGYLLQKGRRFGQAPEDDPGGFIPWHVQSPVTVVLEWAGSNPDALRHTVASATHPQNAPAQVTERAFQVMSTFNLLELAPNVRAQLDGVFEEGVFIVEFAVETRTITVRYHPPTKPSGIQIDEAQLTDATLAPQGLQEADYPASLHFDIGDTPAQRAAFVVRYLESQEETLTTVLGAPNRKLKVGKTAFAALEGDIVFAKPSEAINALAVEKSEIPPLVVVDMNPSKRPLSASGAVGGCQICVVVGGVLRDPWTMKPTGSTIVKCYAKP